MIDSQATVVAAPGLASADLGGEAVLLDADSGRYFGLNEVGLRIFQLAQEPRTVEAIRSALRAEYEVEEEVLVRDVDTFLRLLSERNLIHIEEASTP
jgi:hypothetical protein